MYLRRAAWASAAGLTLALAVPAFAQDDIYGTHYLDGVEIEKKNEPAPAVKHDVWYSLGSWQVMALCQLADIASTEWAFHHNPTAYETNSMSRPVLYSLKLGLPLAMWQIGWNDMGDVGVRVGVNALACLPVVNNIQVGREH